MPGTKKVSRSLVLGILGVLGLIVLGFLRPETRPIGSKAGSESGSPGTQAARTDSPIAAALTALSSAHDPDKARRILADLEARLMALPADEAAAAITTFLQDPSQDATTGLGFVIGDGGWLESPPTLRTALLNWLAQIDPMIAAAVAKGILEAPTTADEWALCLRNVAWGMTEEDGGPEFLAGKWLEMVAVDEWRTNPTVGFLEAFDVLVHARATEATPSLAELAADASQEGQAVAHASFLTLDRLVLTDPSATLKLVSGDEELLATRGTMVAQLMARADLAHKQERDLVADYLLDDRREQEDLEAFTAVFPNANYMVGNNLLTKTRLPGGADRRQRDAIALAQVERWLEEERFAKVRPWLEKMRVRLEQFVEK